MKLSIDKATVQQLFKAVVKASNEVNELSFLHGQNKRRLQVQPMAQASEFYVPNMFNDQIVLTTNVYPDIRGWSNIELANTKVRWESLGIASSSLLSGERQDHMGNYFQILQSADNSRSGD